MFHVPKDIADKLEKLNLSFRVGKGAKGSYCELIDNNTKGVALRKEVNDEGPKGEKAALTLCMDCIAEANIQKPLTERLREFAEGQNVELEKARQENEELKARLAAAIEAGNGKKK